MTVSYPFYSDCVAGNKASLANETLLAGTLREKREERLTEPTEVYRFDEPRMGQIWRFDSRGKFRPNGLYRCLVTLVMPQNVQIGRQPNGSPLMAEVEMVNFAIDYTGMKPYPLHRLEQVWAGNYLPALEEAKRNIAGNEGQGRPLDCLLGRELRKTAIILATGPSLKTMAELVKRVDRSKAYVIALNSAIDAVGAENVDYHFGIDRRFRPEWSNDASDVVGVFHPQVPPEIMRNYKSVYFFGHPGSGHSNGVIRAMYSSYLDGVAELEQACNVGPTAMHFAYLMGAQNIVWLGLDSGWAKDGSTHWKANVNQQVNYNEDAVTVRIYGTDGEMKAEFESKKEYIQAAHYTFGHAYWLQLAGVRVINCTEWGIFYENALAQQPYCNYVRPDIHGVERMLPPCEPYQFEETLRGLALWR